MAVIRGKIMTYIHKQEKTEISELNTWLIALEKMIK
jgi:hypothetical protein